MVSAGARTGRPGVDVYCGIPGTSPLLEPTLITEWFDNAVIQYRDLTCLVEIGPSGTETSRITYQALGRAVDERAKWLREAVPSGTAYVGVRVSNTADSIVDLLSVLRIGAAAVIVDDNDAEERREEQLGLLCGAVIEATPGGRRVRLQIPTFTGTQPDSRPIAFVLYTTGSTAASKPVAQSHYSVLVNVRATIRHHRMTSGQTMACALPVSHVNGLHFGVLATLLSGGTCALFQGFDPLSYLRGLATVGATRATTVPSLLQVLSELRRWPDLPALRYFISAAAPLARGTAQAVYERGRHRVVQGYGLSECMNFATTMPADLAGPEYEDHVLGREVPAVGHPLHGCEVAVLSRDGRTLGEGEVGEVGVRGHSLMSCYVGDEEATARTLRDGWLWTGDLGRLDVTGGHRPWLTLVGRQKNVAKCGGVSVSLEEVDRWITVMPGIREACCVRRADPRRGDALTAFYVALPGSRPESRDLMAHVQRKFDTQLLGLRTVEIGELPRLRSGKLDRRSLEQRL
ncbi:class I adenylate-forming enzyme family protein [Streptomyces sp. SAI-127]|uniref:class I adenylate-forming enzyme family protein n=1 Tax=Streptomyces sp. SAI-127 TaxID=2940543 RepID=UPI00247398C3|nr:class I adenylate-forming enzyme family protein [Streptomyces sp. SAI-127]MDH6492287.1 acyl-CoA synthetase (AMP-forming)/AMP-acid ligase II [Streptomyces sp. SAI-127]